MNKKRGWISFEYIIASAIILVFGVSIFFKFIPNNVRNASKTSVNYITSHMHKANNNKPTGSGSAPIVKPDQPPVLTDFTYTINGSYAVITGYKGVGGNVSIPEEFENKPVLEIGANALNGKNIDSITIPSTVTTIGAEAFANNNISYVNLPNKINNIGPNAFANNKLTSISIPKNVTIIESGTFKNNKISRLNINGQVSRINNSAFANNQLSSVDIPDSVLNIESNAFANNYISKLTIGGNCAIIGSGAFSQQDAPKIAVIVKATGALSSDRFTNIWNKDIWSCSQKAQEEAQSLGRNCQHSIN